MFGENFNARKLQTINRRMFILGVAKFTVFTGIFIRLFSLQINDNKKYLTLSDKNRLREWRLAPVRGEFVDYFDNIIASNSEVYQLHVIPEDVEDFRYLLLRLKNILDLSNSDYKKIITQKKKQKSWETIVISNNLSWEKFVKVNYFLYDLVGAKPVISVSRNYPFDDNYTHILGYVSAASKDDIKKNEIIKKHFVPGLKVGKTGLEKSFEEKLIGLNGVERYEVNAYGKRIKQIDHQKGKKGDKIKLTIDTEIQILANSLLKDRSGSISVMDIYTGEILAMQSSPSFDPNLFVFGISQDDWQLIRNNPLKPLVNKTLSGLYSPGSTIKPMVALSALENNIINKDFEVNCKGKISMYDQTYHCWKKKGHGYMNMRSAIQRSCDVYFYELARKLGVDRLSVTAKKFGLGNKVLKDFGAEKSGVVPNTKWKKKYIGKNWYIGETLHSGIGQGYYLSTPLQLCLMTAQIANGGYKINPHIITDSNLRNNRLKDYIKHQNKNLNEPMPAELLFSNINVKTLFKNKENINFIKDAMYAATNEAGGTSYRSRWKNKKFMFAGKTGSSQIKRFTEAQRKAEIKQDEIIYKDRDHALFVAFAPVSDPKYAISVVVEHGGSGSSSAAPIAKQVIKKVLERDSARSSYIHTEGKEI